MADTDLDIWQDAEWVDEGLAVTTYSQAPDDDIAVVEGESYWTWSELADGLDDVTVPAGLADYTADGAPDMVAVPVETAEVALRELNITVTETGGDDRATSERDHTSPLARVRQGLEALENVDERTRREALQVVYNVAAALSVELSDVDPLQADVFRAEQALAAALQEVRD